MRAHHAISVNAGVRFTFGGRGYRGGERI